MWNYVSSDTETEGAMYHQTEWEYNEMHTAFSDWILNIGDSDLLCDFDLDDLL